MFIFILIPHHHLWLLVHPFGRFVISLVYYGISLNVGNFGLDIYLTQLIFGIAELPARLGCYPLVERFGRKKSQCAMLLLGGTACLVILAIPAGGQTNGTKHFYGSLPGCNSVPGIGSEIHHNPELNKEASEDG